MSNRHLPNRLTHTPSRPGVRRTPAPDALPPLRADARFIVTRFQERNEIVPDPASPAHAFLHYEAIGRDLPLNLATLTHEFAEAGVNILTASYGVRGQDNLSYRAALAGHATRAEVQALHARLHRQRLVYQATLPASEPAPVVVIERPYQLHVALAVADEVGVLAEVTRKVGLECLRAALQADGLTARAQGTVVRLRSAVRQFSARAVNDVGAPEGVPGFVVETDIAAETPQILEEIDRRLDDLTRSREFAWLQRQKDDCTPCGLFEFKPAPETSHERFPLQFLAADHLGQN